MTDIDDWDKPIPEGVDPYNLTGRDPTRSIWKNGRRPSPDYYVLAYTKNDDDPDFMDELNYFEEVTSDD
jgi:hypothetical protein